MKDPRFRAKQLEQTRLMVRNSFNHPCVILWGFLNETRSDLPEARPLIAGLVHAVKTIDPDRPVTFASCCIGYGEQCLDLVDVISCNIYPAWYGPERGKYDAALLSHIGERFDKVEAILSAPDLKDRPPDPERDRSRRPLRIPRPFARPVEREYQTGYVAEVCRKLKKGSRFQGLTLWQFADGKTYPLGASNRARSFNNKGSVDEYRREKLVCDVVRREFPDLLTSKLRNPPR